MEITSINQLTAVGKTIARYSFLIGSAIFLIYCITRYAPIIPVGIVFLAIAVIVNSLILLVLLITMAIYQEHYKPLLRTAIIMLVNLPIALLYFFIITRLV